MTASKSTVSQVSHLEWERTGTYWLDSREGYRVQVTRTENGWTYLAHGPKRQLEKRGREPLAVIDPLKGRIPFKVRYDIGDEIPLRHECLGAFDSELHGSTAAAKAEAIAVCEEHHRKVRQQATGPVPGPYQPPGMRGCGGAEFMHSLDGEFA